jgi:hypothetical protein
MQTSVAFAGILGIALILSVSIYVFGRLRIEQQNTLQKMIDRGVSGDELLRAAGFVDLGSRDLRRGLLLIGVGVSWSTVTFFAGGGAWMFGIVPLTMGAVFVLLRVLDGRPR